MPNTMQKAACGLGQLTTLQPNLVLLIIQQRSHEEPWDGKTTGNAADGEADRRLGKASEKSRRRTKHPRSPRVLATARSFFLSLQLFQRFWLVFRCRKQDPVSRKSFPWRFLKKTHFLPCGKGWPFSTMIFLEILLVCGITFERIELQQWDWAHFLSFFLYFLQILCSGP